MTRTHELKLVYDAAQQARKYAPHLRGVEKVFVIDAVEKLLAAIAYFEKAQAKREGERAR